MSLLGQLKHEVKHSNLILTAVTLDGAGYLAVLAALLSYNVPVNGCFRRILPNGEVPLAGAAPNHDEYLGGIGGLMEESVLRRPCTHGQHAYST